MTGMILFAIIGATINAGNGYWICYAIHCVLTVCRAVAEVIREEF